MSFTRALKHLLVPSWSVRRVFGESQLNAIEQAIRETEAQHGGEIRIAVEGNLAPGELWRGVTPRQRAVQIFAQLGVWDTEANNGVLIYVSWADHDVEIVADRGFNGAVSGEEWSAVCASMEKLFAQDQPQAAMIEGIRAVGKLIARHFPAIDRNELADRPVVM